MIRDIINSWIKEGQITRHERGDWSLLYNYFNRQSDVSYLELVVQNEGIRINVGPYDSKGRIIESSYEERQYLLEIIKGGGKYIRGANEIIYKEKFYSLWKMFYSDGLDVLIVPCYYTEDKLYLACIGDFKKLKVDCGMETISYENTILDEFPVLLFLVKFCTYEYFFERRDSAWNFIFGCGNMVRMVRVIENILQYFDMPGLELFQELSNMPYEGRKNIGVIDFVDNYLGDVRDYKIGFVDVCAICKKQGRILRKYLQFSDESNHLIATRYNAYEQANQCWVIGGQGGGTDTERLCIVRFLGNSKWSCTLKNEEIFYNGTEYVLQITSKDMQDSNCKEEIEKMFGTQMSQGIIDVIEAIKGQTHGALLVITDEAAIEAKRLGKIHRAIRVKELCLRDLQKEMVLSLTSIDGAIMMDSKCTCYAIGTILDGIADNVYSNMARGARYNSAYTYIYNMRSAGKKCAAVVISEDGMLDVITTDNIDNTDTDLFTWIYRDDMIRRNEDFEDQYYDDRDEGDCWYE